MKGTLTVQGAWDKDAVVRMPVQLPGGEALVQLGLVAKQPQLWWPVNMGDQPLYNISVAFQPDGNELEVVIAQRRIGCRMFALVKSNDADPDSLVGQNGSGNFTFTCRINGAPIVSRGSNMIHMDQLEGRRSTMMPGTTRSWAVGDPLTTCCGAHLPTSSSPLCSRGSVWFATTA